MHSEDKVCACGCGSAIGPDSTWSRGHNRSARRVCRLYCVKKGHRLTPANTIWRLDGTRACRECVNATQRAVNSAPYQREMRIKRQNSGVCPACGNSPPEDGFRTCSTCRAKRRTNAQRSRPNRRQYHREWTAWNKYRTVGYWLKSHYGISVAEYNAMITAQQGRCAICRVAPDGRRNPLCIDHDHVTGQIRGLLCSRCNRGLGFLRDDRQAMRALAAYLSKALGPVLPC